MNEVAADQHGARSSPSVCGGAAYIELKNTGTCTVTLKGFGLSVFGNSGLFNETITTDLLVEAGGFFYFVDGLNQRREGSLLLLVETCRLISKSV